MATQIAPILRVSTAADPRKTRGYLELFAGAEHASAILDTTAPGVSIAEDDRDLGMLIGAGAGLEVPLSGQAWTVSLGVELTRSWHELFGLDTTTDSVAGVLLFGYRY